MARKLTLQSPQEAHLLTGGTLLDGPGSISRVEGSASQAPEAQPETKPKFTALDLAKRIRKLEIDEREIR